MKFSTFHSFMLVDAKGSERLLEGQAVGRAHHEAIANELALIQRADQLGYDGVWVREHHFTDYGFLPNTMVLLAQAAAMTTRIRLGTAVVTLPLHHPVRAAEDAALVDVLSGGRLDYGVGRGYQSVEFDVLGVPLDEARSRTDEALEIITKLWTDPAASHHSPRWSFDRLCLQPRPLQRPHPPIYYASINPDSIAHYAAKGIPFIVDSTIRTSQLEELAATWREVAIRHGHDPSTRELVAVRYAWVDDSDEAAREYVAKAPVVTSLTTDRRLQPRRADGTFAEGYGYWDKGWHGRDLGHYDPADDWDDRWLAGSPERVTEQIKHLEAIGIGNVCVVFGLDRAAPGHHELGQRMTRFAEAIFPGFRGQP